eukprot:2628306-Amphidinium_carterae.1
MFLSHKWEQESIYKCSVRPVILLELCLRNVSCVSSPWRFRMEEPLSLQLKEGYAGEASRVTR